MNTQKLNQLIDTMPSRGIPVCDMIVTRDAETIYRRMTGFSDTPAEHPVSDNTLYWCFSTSKVITCVAAMMLVERGIISPSDRLDRYIPEFAHMKVQQRDGSLCDAETPILLEHLFTMTAGMSYDVKQPPLIDACQNPDAGTVDVVRAMAQIPLLFEPGTRYRYSLCHDVLAAVVEVASGMRFSEFVRKNIFDPCEMSEIGYHPTDEQLKRFCAMHTFVGRDGTCKPCGNENIYRFTKEYESGGAGVFTRTDEYIKMLSALACTGTPRGRGLLRPETVAMMEQNRLCPTALNDFVNTRLYGYGWGYCGRVHINPAYSLSLSSVGEFGWDGAAGAFAMVDRKTRTALYFSSHILSCGYMYRIIHPLIRNLVFEELD